MNKIDRSWYTALRFLSTLNTENVKEIKEKRPDFYRKKVPEKVESMLHIRGYIHFENYSNIVSEDGLKQLRVLEEIRRKDFTLIASVIAVIISLVALGISIASFINS